MTPDVKKYTDPAVADYAKGDQFSKVMRRYGISRLALVTALQAHGILKWYDDPSYSDRPHLITAPTPQDILSEIANIAMASMGDYFEVDDYGQPQVNLSMVPTRAFAAIQEISTETVVDGGGSRIRKTKVKLYNKLDALFKLAQIAGMITEQVKHEFSSLTDEQREAAIAKLFDSARARAVRPPDSLKG